MIKRIMLALLLVGAQQAWSIDSVFRLSGLDSLTSSLPHQVNYVQSYISMNGGYEVWPPEELSVLNTYLAKDNFENHLDKYLKAQLGNSKMKKLAADFAMPAIQKLIQLERRAAEPSFLPAFQAYKETTLNKKPRASRVDLLKKVIQVTGIQSLPVTLNKELITILSNRKMVTINSVAESDLVDFYLYAFRTVSDEEIKAYLTIYRQPLQRDLVALMDTGIKDYFKLIRQELSKVREAAKEARRLKLLEAQEKQEVVTGEPAMNPVN